jgi:hypothetical protein
VTDGTFTPRQFVADPQDTMRKLDAYAHELEWLSNKLADIEQQLNDGEGGGVEVEYQRFVDDFEVGLWRKHEDSEGKVKLPSEAMRLKLAHEAMKPELLGRYVGLLSARRRLKDRAQRVRSAVESQRSILSYLKEAGSA